MAACLPLSDPLPLHLPYPIFIFHFPGYNMLRFQAGTASGVHFMAALQLAARCSGLVGHFSSGTTRLLYLFMCMQHAGSQGRCPPAYDFRDGLWLLRGAEAEDDIETEAEIKAGR